MDVDYHTVREIREHRVESDPIIAYKGKEAWLDQIDTGTLSITEARKERNKTAPVETPFSNATWAEVTIYCFTASMDERVAMKQLLAIYQYAFSQATKLAFDESLSDMIPDNVDIVTTDTHEEMAADLRTEIAASQHMHFLDNVYDSIEIDTSGVPKAFWKQSTSNEDNNENQVTINDF